MTPTALETRSAATTGTRPLTVVQVVRSLNTGGQEVLCARLMEQLNPARFQAHIIALHGGGWISSHLESAGFGVHVLDAPEGLRPELVLQVARVLRTIGADVVHCHNQAGFFYGGLAAALTPRTGLLLTKHGRTDWSGSRTAPILRALLRRTGAVVAVSDDVSRLLQEGRWVRPERLHTVLNGVDTEAFAPGKDAAAARVAVGLPADAPVVGTVARLAPEKDQATLIRAFERVLAAVPQARLLLVGDGVLRAELESLAKELGIQDHTLFLGERREVGPLLPAMDVFCLPSLSEGTPLTVLEAMASGLPVVASAVGGLPEVVEEGRSGHLVPPQQPEVLAETLVRVLRDPSGGRRMGIAGRETVIERYSLAAMVSRYASLYEQLSGRAPA